MHRTSLALILALASVSSLAACAGGPEGRWAGELPEGFVLPSGSTHVVVIVDRAGTGTTPDARVVFGAGPRPEDPTDPNVPWPPGSSSDAGALNVAEGVAYQAIDGVTLEDRLHFVAGSGDLYDPWCAIQTSYDGGGGEYYCLPPAPYDMTTSGCVLHPDGGADQTVDCRRLDICSTGQQCACDAEGCIGVPDGDQLEVSFVWDGDEAEGAIVLRGSTAPAIPLHLHRR